MKHITTIAAAGILAATVLPAAAADIYRRRRDIRLSDLRQMGGCLQERDQRRPELSVDRLGRRHQADHRQDRDVRRHRHAAQAGRSRQEQFRAVPGHHGRRRAGRESRRASSRAKSRSTARRSPRSSSATSRTGTIRRSRSSIPAPSCPTRRSPSCIVRMVPARPSSGPTIFRRSAPDWKSKVGEQHLGRMAGRHRRQRQRRRRQQRRRKPWVRSATSSTPMPSRTI